MGAASTTQSEQHAGAGAEHGPPRTRMDVRPQLKDDTRRREPSALTDVAALLPTRNLSLDFPSALLHAHLPLLGGLHQLPAVGLEVVELVKLHADVLDGQLQQVPEPGQVLGSGTRVGVRVLCVGEQIRISGASKAGAGPVPSSSSYNSSAPRVRRNIYEAMKPIAGHQQPSRSSALGGAGPVSLL